MAIACLIKTIYISPIVWVSGSCRFSCSRFGDLTVQEIDNRSPALDGFWQIVKILKEYEAETANPIQRQINNRIYTQAGAPRSGFFISVVATQSPKLLKPFLPRKARKIF